MLPIGNCSYEIRLRGEIIAFEDVRFDGSTIVGVRKAADGLSYHRVDAVLNSEQRVCSVTLSYSSTLFTRKGSYEAVEDNFCGRISGLTGRNEIVVKLGRFREVDAADFLIFRALIIDHIRMRGEQRWTGRVAVIDPNTLATVSAKQNCTRRDGAEYSWIYEPRMGDVEQIELNDAGHIVSRRDNRGITAKLVATGRSCD